MTQPQGQINIPVSSIVPSKLNPRKRIDKKTLAELTSNVKERGILQAILVRPLNGGSSYEAVFGHRRLLAAQGAGLETIPANVRELSDTEALELMVIENHQRQDPHPLEEAEGYEALLKHKHPDGTPYTVDDIAAKIDKSRSYVYQKLKLCSLSKEARKAYYDEALDFSKALLLARIYDPDQQKAALADLTSKRHGGDPMTFREAQRHVHEHYMLKLSEARFSTADEKLLPKAGSCDACPKRSGNQPELGELFVDAKAGDICTDSKCYQAKTIAFVTARKGEAASSGQIVITGKEAKAIKPYPGHAYLNGGYVTLDQRCFEDQKQRTYKEILGDDVMPTLLEDPHHTAKLIEVVKLEEIKPALKAKGVALREPRVPSTQKPRKAAAAPKPKVDLEAEIQKRLLVTLCAKLPTSLTAADLALVANELLNFASLETPETVANLLLPKRPSGLAEAALRKVIPKLDVPALNRLIVAIVLANSASGDVDSDPDILLDTAQRWKVDTAAIRKQVEGEIAAKSKPTAAIAKKKPTKPTPGKKSTAKKAAPKNSAKGKK